MNSTTRNLLNNLMRDTQYNIFKCVNTSKDTTRISVIVPKKALMYYKDKSHRVVGMSVRTRSATKQFKLINTYVYNDMGIGSKLCTMDICIDDIDSRIDIQKIEYLKNEKYYIFIDSTPFCCITRFYEDKYAEEIEVYDSLKHVGVMKNNIANIIVDVVSVTNTTHASNIKEYTTITFGIYKLRTSSVMHLTDVRYKLPYILLTEDYNYNNATIERLYDKIYEEYLD